MTSAASPEVVIFDTEFTAWPGSMDRGWSGPGEHKEVIQIGAVAISAIDFAERRSFEIIIRPVKNPRLSNYLIDLTRITNERIASDGVDFATGISRFLTFSQDCRLYSYGRDDKIIAGNARLLDTPTVWPDRTATDLKEWLIKIGVPLAGVHSGALSAHVGSKAQGVAHDALVDARSLAEAVRYLVARGAPNPFRL